MDGGQVCARINTALRSGRLLPVRRLLGVLSAAMIPLALLTASEAAAEDVPPATRYAVGSPAMLLAQDIARRHWGVTPCGGQVSVEWGSDEPSVNARSYWANPRSAYDAPELNVQCRVVFNTTMSYTWVKFCTVLVHEFGHLVGKPHGPDGPDVMSPIYRTPLPACAGEEPGVGASAIELRPAETMPAAPVEVGAPATTRRTKARTDRARARAQARRSQPRARAAAMPLRRYSGAHDGHGHHHHHH